MSRDTEMVARAADMLDECANELATALSAASSRVASEARSLARELRASATARDATLAAPRRAQRGEDGSARDAVSEAEREVVEAAERIADEHDSDDGSTCSLCAAVSALRTAREVKP